MDPRHRQLLGEKDYLQLRQQVKAYLPFCWLLPFLMHVSIIIIITYKYLYNFYMLEKR